MPFPELKIRDDHHNYCGRSACTVQRSIIDLSGIDNHDSGYLGIAGSPALGTSSFGTLLYRNIANN